MGAKKRGHSAMAEDTVKVFLADSSYETILILKSLLARSDIEITDSAANGTAALEKLRQAQPDVLVTDLLLPGLDGLSLLRALRREQRMPRTVVITAFWNDRVAREAGRLGVDYYLPKPCSAETLAACIRDLASGEAAPPLQPDAAVRDQLLRFPIPAHLNGYRYLCAGLEMVLQDRNCLQGVTKALYRDLARQFRTTAECVERSMRAAIAEGWQRGSPEQRAREFGSVFEGDDRPPSITRFLSEMAELITLQRADGAFLRRR